MGLSNFWEIFAGETVFSPARLTYALASNRSDDVKIRKSIATQIEKTDAVFVDIAFALMNMTGDDFVTSDVICNDLVISADANMYTKTARFPLTIAKMATYITAYINRLIKSRPAATVFMFGTDSHVHVPVTKHNTWNTRDYNGNEHSASSKAPFSKNEETLTTSLLYIAQNDPAEFQNAILGATFTTPHNMLHDMLKDRYIRPMLLSVLFDLVVQQLKDAPPDRDVCIHFVHPIFDMTVFPMVLRPNLYKNGGWTVSTAGCDIGEADMQFAWFLEQVHADVNKDNKLQIEVHCDDSDVVMITQSFYLHLSIKLKLVSKEAYEEEMPVIYMFRGRCQMIDLRHVYFECIPALYGVVTKETRELTIAGIHAWYRFFSVFCLIMYQTDYEPIKIHGLGSTYKNMVSILSILHQITLTKRDDTAKNKYAIFTLVNHRLVEYEYGTDMIFPVRVTFDSVQMIKLVQMTIKIHHKKRAKTDDKLTNARLVEDIHTHIFVHEDVFNVLNNNYQNMSLLELKKHWNAYILYSGKVCPKEVSESTVKHPVLQIRKHADAETHNTLIDFGNIKTPDDMIKLWPIYSFATTEQLQSFLLYVLSACEYGPNTALNRRIYERDHPCAHEDDDIPFSHFNFNTSRKTTGGIQMTSEESMGNVQNISQSSSIITNPFITGKDTWEDYKSDKRMASLGRSVFFPGDLTAPAVFSRVAMIQWTLCYWAAGFRQQCSKQSIIDHDKAYVKDSVITFDSAERPTSYLSRKDANGQLVFSNEKTRYPQFAELLLLGGYTLCLRKFAGGNTLIVSDITRHPPYEVVKFVKDKQSSSHSMIVTMDLMPSGAAESVSISHKMIAHSRLFAPLRPLSINIESVDPVYNQMIKSIKLLRMTELDHMAALSLINRNWLDVYCDILRETQRISYDNNVESVVYADEQLIFRYIYATSIMEKDTSVYTDAPQPNRRILQDDDDNDDYTDTDLRIPHATGTTCLLETIPYLNIKHDRTEKIIHLCVPTTTSQHMSPITDVTLNSNNLGEYVLGYAFPEAISGKTYSSTADPYPEDRDLQAMLTTNNIQLTEVVVCNRTDAVQTSETFQSGIYIRIAHADNNETNIKNALPRIVRNVSASLYYATIPLRITENARVQSRSVMTAKNVQTLINTAQHCVNSLYRINIQTDEYINRRLSTSLHVCDYGLPLLKLMPYDSRPDYWTQYMMPWLCLFKEYIEQSFVSFVKWKIVLSVYHRFCARNVVYVDFVKPSTGYFVSEFFKASIGDAQYTAVSIQQITNTARMYTHLTWPVAFIDLHKMAITTPDEFGKKVFSILQQSKTACSALCFCWPSAANAYVSVTRVDSTPDIVAKITFVDWDESVLQHYVFSGLLRMQNMMTYKPPFDSLVETPILTVGDGEGALTIKMVFEKTLTGRQN